MDGTIKIHDRQLSPNVLSFIAKVRDGRPLTMLVIGGSNSVGVMLNNSGETYFNQFKDMWDKEIYSSTLTPYSISVGATGSDLFLFCLQNFLPGKQPDIVLIDQAVNDFGSVYGKASIPMELLTRRLLLLPSRPIVIYVNIVMPDVYQSEIRNPNCTNMEDFGFTELAKHYGVPSISIRDFICPLTRSGQREINNSTLALFATDGKHIKFTSHTRIASMLMEYFKNLLATNKEITAANTQGYSQNRPLSLGKPLFSEPSIIDDQLTLPMCWSHLTPNIYLPFKQTLDAHVIRSRGFLYEPPSQSRWNCAFCFDSTDSGWAAIPGFVDLQIQFSIPLDTSIQNSTVALILKYKPLFPFSVKIWLNDKNSTCTEINNERDETTIRVFIRVLPIATGISPGNYTLNIQGEVQYFHFIGIVIGYSGFHDYEGYKNFKGSLRTCKSN